MLVPALELTPSATAETLATPADADAYVSAAAPDTNYGSQPDLNVRDRHKDPEVAFIHFTLTMPPDAVVTGAQLRLWARTGSSDATIEAHAVIGSWTEDAVTWATAPAVGTAATDAVTDFTARQPLVLDVASLVTGNDVDVAIVTNRPQEESFASREDAAEPPTLTVSYATPTRTPTPTPTPTASTEAPATPTPTPITTSSTPTPIPSTTPSGSEGPCGTSTSAPPTPFSHVVWIVMENKSYSEVIGSPNAPYINRVAAECGSATQFSAEARPSLPNYLAMTSGSTQGVTDDGSPASHPILGPSLFSQTSGDWRSLQESMPSNCLDTDSGLYAVHHNPAAYYTGLAAECLIDDQPYASPPDVSARFTFITPNMCDDMHSCSSTGTIATEVAAGDAWLSKELPRILSSSEYASGSTVVFVTWDEGDFDQHVPTLVLSPYTQPGTTSSTAFNHYSLLRTTEDLLGITTHLGSAATAAGMAAAFGL